MENILVLVILLSWGILLGSGADKSALDAPAINPEFLDKLSGRLLYEECYKLCNFLAAQTLNPENARFKLNCPLLGGKTKSVKLFHCISTLHYWNEDIMMKQTGDMLDRISYAEDLLEIGLRRSGRPDLSNWVKKGFYERHHLENQDLNHEFQKHVRAGQKELLEEMMVDGKIKLKSTTSTESEAEYDEHNQILIFKLIMGICLVGIVIMIVLITVAVMQTPSKKPPRETRQVRDYRFKVYTDESESEPENVVFAHSSV